MPGKVPLTVVIPTLNEADQIGELVASLGWAGEVIVADGGSTDQTIGIATKAGARVLESTGPTIAAQRNAAIAQASNQWILAVDSDERVSEELRQELERVLPARAHAA